MIGWRRWSWVRPPGSTWHLLTTAVLGGCVGSNRRGQSRRLPRSPGPLLWDSSWAHSGGSSQLWWASNDEVQYGPFHSPMSVKTPSWAFVGPLTSSGLIWEARIYGGRALDGSRCFLRDYRVSYFISVGIPLAFLHPSSKESLLSRLNITRWENVLCAGNLCLWSLIFLASKSTLFLQPRCHATSLLNQSSIS